MHLSVVQILGGMATMDVDWSKWTVLWVDERCVPHDDAESNYGGAVAAWLSKVRASPPWVPPQG